MTSNLETCLLRLCNEQGETQGTGFVVSNNLAVTCAHVIDWCGAGPGSHVQIVFHATGQVGLAEVLPDYWHSQDGDDVAVLSLMLESQPLPKGVVPAALGSTRYCNGHPMWTVGFAELPDGYAYAWAEGLLHTI